MLLFAEILSPPLAHLILSVWAVFALPRAGVVLAANTGIATDATVKALRQVRIILLFILITSKFNTIPADRLVHFNQLLY